MQKCKGCRSPTWLKRSRKMRWTLAVGNSDVCSPGASAVPTQTERKQTRLRKRAGVRSFPLNSTDGEDRVLQIRRLTLSLADWTNQRTFLLEKGRASAPWVRACPHHKWVSKECCLCSVGGCPSLRFLVIFLDCCFSTAFFVSVLDVFMATTGDMNSVSAGVINLISMAPPN